MRSDFLFVHSAVDDAGLTPLQFRLLAHLSRRAGADGRIYSSIADMSAVCGLHANTIKTGLRELKKLNIITSEQREGGTALRRILPPAEWKTDLAQETTQVQNMCRGGKRPGSENGTPLGTKQVPPPGTKNVPQRVSKEGNPKKELPPNPPRGGMPTAHSVDDWVEAEGIYRLYPRKTKNRPQAIHAIGVILREVSATTLRAAVQRYASSPRARAEEGRSVPAPDKWFRNGCWRDYIPKPPAPSVPVVAPTSRVLRLRDLLDSLAPLSQNQISFGRIEFAALTDEDRTFLSDGELGRLCQLLREPAGNGEKKRQECEREGIRVNVL